MPGPGQRKKQKPRTHLIGDSSSQTASRTLSEPEPYVGEIDHAAGWSIVVDILCDVFELPDITTRSGLKNVHRNFDAIYRKLEKACNQYPNNIRIAGGIVGIYAKLCSDAILRDRLWEKGLLNKLLPLLEDETTRNMALRALTTITHHGGQNIRAEIALHSSVLIKLLESFPDDQVIHELIISILSHCVGAVLDSDTPNGNALEKLDMRAILKQTTESLKKDWASTFMIGHGLSLLASSTLGASEACKAYLPMQRLLIAGLRTNDWVTKCICLGGIIRLYQKEAESDIRTMDPQKLIASVERGFKEILQDAMMDYGLPRCDTYLTLRTTADFQKAMMKTAQDRDLYVLGLTIADFIPRTEFSVANGMFLAENPSTGKREPMDVGLPFTRWVDCLPPCAKAIRARGNPKEQDLADILDIKYAIMNQRIPDAVELSWKGIQRNPHQAYFYYAITLSANNVEGLKAAKKGLKCKQITPFIRFQLLQRAVEHAGDMGIRILQDSPKAGHRKWEEGIAFLMSALDDAKTFVANAPPDNRHKNGVLYWYILLSIVTKGKELSPNMKELQPAFEARELADDFLRAIQIRPPNTNLRLTQQTVVKQYPAACIEFARVIEKIDAERSDHTTTPKRTTEDDLAVWLEDTHIHDGEFDGELHGVNPKVNFNTVELYRCSHCGNPSAMLRKCSGCDKTRYCDVACQRAHWVDHKKICKAPEKTG